MKHDPMTNSEGQPLIEKAFLGTSRAYRFFTYTEHSKHPSLHVCCAKDFEIVARADNLIVLEVAHNESPYRFVKGQQPPAAVLDVIAAFLDAEHADRAELTNREAFYFIWQAMNWEIKLPRKRGPALTPKPRALLG